jgi:hypothetical protein
MKTDNGIIGKQLAVNGLIIAVFILFPINVISQKGKEISLTAYPGFTMVNFEKALGSVPLRRFPERIYFNG